MDDTGHSHNGIMIIGSRQTVIYLLITSLITTIVFEYDGIASLPILLFFSVSLYLSTLPANGLGILSWQAGIPLYYATMFLYLPLLTRFVGRTDTISTHEMGDTLLVATAGLSSFGVGAAIMRHLSQDRIVTGYLKNTLFEKINSFSILICLGVIGTLSIIWSYFWGYYGLNVANEIGKSAGVVSTFTFFLTVAHLVSWNGFFKAKGKKYLWLGLITTVILITSAIFSNSKTAFILPIFLIGLSLWGVSGRFPLKLLVFSLLVFTFIAFPFVTVSRYVVFASGAELSKFEIARTTLDYLLSFDWTNQLATYSETGATVSMGRGLLEYFSLIIHETGNSVDFLYGSTFSHGLETFIPRFLYPDKPGLTIGNFTAHHYGLLASTDAVTSLSPSLMGEFFMNFGFIGVIFGMMLIGCLAVVVDRHIIFSRDNWSMPYAIFCIGWQESVIGQAFLPFIKNILILWFVLFILSRVIRDTDAH